MPQEAVRLKEEPVWDNEGDREPTIKISLERVQQTHEAADTVNIEIEVELVKVEPKWENSTISSYWADSWDKQAGLSNHLVNAEPAQDLDTLQSYQERVPLSFALKRARLGTCGQKEAQAATTNTVPESDALAQKSPLQDHKENNRDRPFTCETCKKEFRQLGNLKRHERTHTGQKPYSCEVCQKGFTQMSSLNRHERVHTGEKPFACEICKKLFSQKSHFNRHKRIHTGEKPYSCKICEKEFAVSGTLNKHKLVHTGEKPHSCKMCNKEFAYLSNLKTHERIHTRVKPQVRMRNM